MAFHPINDNVKRKGGSSDKQCYTDKQLAMPSKSKNNYKEDTSKQLGALQYFFPSQIEETGKSKYECKVFKAASNRMLEKSFMAWLLLISSKCKSTENASTLLLYHGILTWSLVKTTTTHPQNSDGKNAFRYGK